MSFFFYLLSCTGVLDAGLGKSPCRSQLGLSGSIVIGWTPRVLVFFPTLSLADSSPFHLVLMSIIRAG